MIFNPPYPKDLSMSRLGRILYRLESPTLITFFMVVLPILAILLASCLCDAATITYQNPLPPQWEQAGSEYVAMASDFAVHVQDATDALTISTTGGITYQTGVFGVRELEEGYTFEQLGVHSMVTPHLSSNQITYTSCETFANGSGSWSFSTRADGFSKDLTLSASAEVVFGTGYDAIAVGGYLFSATDSAYSMVALECPTDTVGTPITSGDTVSAWRIAWKDANGSIHHWVDCPVGYTNELFGSPIAAKTWITDSGLFFVWENWFDIVRFDPSVLYTQFAVDTLLQTVNTGHTTVCVFATYSPDGTKIITAGSNDKTFKIWDASTYSLRRTINSGHSNYCDSASYSPDGTKIITSGDTDNTFKIWNASTYALITTIVTYHTAGCYTAFYSPDGTKIITAGGTEKVYKVWNASTYALLQTVNTGHTTSCYFATYSPDGTKIVTSGFADKTFKIWDASTYSLLQTINSGHSNYCDLASYSPDGTKIITSGNADQTYKIWNASTYALLQTVNSGHANCYTAIYSPDGTKIITSGHPDNTYKVFSETLYGTNPTITDLATRLSAYRTDTQVFFSVANKANNMFAAASDVLLPTNTVVILKSANTLAEVTATPLVTLSPYRFSAYIPTEMQQEPFEATVSMATMASAQATRGTFQWLSYDEIYDASPDSISVDAGEVAAGVAALPQWATQLSAISSADSANASRIQAVTVAISDATQALGAQINDATAHLDSTVNAIDLSTITARIDDATGYLDSAISAIDLSSVTSRIDDATTYINNQLASLIVDLDPVTERIDDATGYINGQLSTLSTSIGLITMRHGISSRVAFATVPREQDDAEVVTAATDIRFVTGAVGAIEATWNGYRVVQYLNRTQAGEINAVVADPAATSLEESVQRLGYSEYLEILQ